MQHVHTVLPVLYAKAELELGVGPDIVVNCTAGLLCRKDQVHAKTSADLRDADQLLHEFRLFSLELRELIDDDKQMRNRLIRLMVLVKLCIQINIIDAVIREDPLPSQVLTLDTDHSPAHLVSGQVTDQSCKVRNARKQVRHTAALEVDDKEADVLRAEVDCKRKDIGLQSLTLTGTCSTGYQAVRSVEFFMYIQITQVSARFYADGNAHTVVGTVFAPAFKYKEVLHRVRFVHFHKADRIGDLCAFLCLLNLNVGERLSESLKRADTHCIGGEDLHLGPVNFHEVIDGVIITVIFNDHLAAVGKLGERLYHEKCSHAVFRSGMIDVFGEHLSFQAGTVLNKDHIVRLRDHAFLAVFLPVSQYICKMEENIAIFQFVSGHKTDTLVFRPDVREPSHAFPVFQMISVLLIKNIDKFDIRVAMASCDRCCQYTHQIIGAASLFTSDQTDQLILSNINADRDLMQRTELVLDRLRLILQRIIDQREFFLGHIDRNLERRVAKAQPLIQKVVMRRVPVPQLRTSVRVAQALRGGRIHPVHSACIVQIHISDLLCDLDQIITIGVESDDLILRSLFRLVIKVQDRPESADHRGSKGCNKTCIHKDA